jgi:hypothetical protein
MILFLAWVVKSHLDKQKKVFADETKKSANKILVMMGINLIYVLASLANGLLFPSVPLTTSSIFSITIGPVAIYMFGTVFLYAGLTMAAAVLTSQMIEFFSVEAYKKHQSFILSPEGKKWFSDNYKSKLSPMEFKHYVWLYDFRGIVTFYLATGFMPFAYMIFTTSGASAGPLCILGFLCPALAAWLYVLSLGSKNVDYKPEEGSAPSIE